MINRILMEIYDDYEKEDLSSLNDFANKTFGNEDARNLFMGCTLILFSRCKGSKPRYDATRENLLEIVKLAKEKVSTTNLLNFYVIRLNTNKNVLKVFSRLESEESYENGSNIVIEYLEQFKPRFINEVKQYDKKIIEFINNDIK